jgi:hypothetical protein
MTLSTELFSALVISGKRDECMPARTGYIFFDTQPETTRQFSQIYVLSSSIS